MRLAIVIFALAVVAVGMVQIRRAELSARHDMQLLQARYDTLRRQYWDQEARLAYLTTPEIVKQRAAEMSLGLVNSPWKVATPTGPRRMP